MFDKLLIIMIYYLCKALKIFKKIQIIKIGVFMSKKQFVQTGTETPNRPKAKFGLKPFAFFSGVFDVVFAIAILVLGTITIIQLWQAIDTGNRELNVLSGLFYSPVLIGVGVLFGIGGILFLTMGIMTLVSAFKSDRKNANGLLIAVIVFDVLLLVPSIMLAFSQEGKNKIYAVCLAVLLALGLIFKIIDVVLTKKRLNKYLQQRDEQARKTYTGANFDNLKPTNDSGAKVQNPEQAKPNPEQTPKSSQNQPNPDDDSSGVDFSKLGK